MAMKSRSIALQAPTDYYKTISQLWESAYQVEWLRLVFLVILPLYAFTQLSSTPLLLPTFLWAVSLYILTGIGITAGYHRLWAHSSYSARYPLKIFLALVGTGALQGSIRWWSGRHRSHHRYTDTDHDPYSVNKGMFHAHVGWTLWRKPRTTVGRVDVRDLDNDPIVKWQHRHISILQLITGIAIPTAVPGLLWDDWRGGFIYAFILRMFAIHHATFAVNSLAHWLGEAPFDDRHTPRDHFITALFTFGEGYHNFHHTFPSDYRNALRWYQFDPTKWLIRLWAKMGLAYDLKEFPAVEVDRSRLQQERKILVERQRGVDAKLDAMDWGVSLSDLPVLGWDEYVKSAHGDHKALVAIAGVIYDVAAFAQLHPGGPAMVHSMLGKDATAAFNGGIYAHSRAARNMMIGLRHAVLRGGGEVEIWKPGVTSTGPVS